MRDVNSFGPKFAGHALRKCAQRMLGTRKCGEAFSPTQARRGTGEDDCAATARQHCLGGFTAHQKATKIWPLNHGVSATLSIIATQKFRCMYCGTLYDLMKIPSHLSGKDESKYSGEYTAYTKDEPS